jgi:DNA ligase-associated metallophosphoesterase
VSATHLIEVAGERLVLDAARVVYWPRARTLLVADVHFGKAQVFRRAGIPIPQGSTSSDLARLDAAIARHDVARVLVLGDLVHGAARADDLWLARVRAWRAAHAAVEMRVVPGNHDRHFDPRETGFDITRGVLVERPFAFAHHPAACPDAYVLAGHLHPGLELRELGARARLPVFWFGRDVGVLPAFGRMTGLAMVEPDAGDRIVAVVDTELLPLRAAAFAAASR